MIRVYEFAKKHGLASRAVIDFLKEKGVVVANHMVALTNDQLSLLSVLARSANTNMIKDKAQPMKSEQQVITSEKNSKKISHAVFSKNLIDTQEDVHQLDKSNESVQGQVVKKDVAAVVINVPAQPYSVDEFALLVGKLSSEIIVLLLGWGIVPAKNQKLNLDVITRLVRHYQAVLVPLVTQKNEKSNNIVVNEQNNFACQTEPRIPVVVIIGHVDHGKTTLLDFIRSTRVALKEKGGITQHVSAYEVKTHHGNIVFIDTPGHEAFVKIRQRGLRVADIAILVIAADDGVMPQTIEAIRQAREAKMVIVVAINKMDKVDPARVDTIKSQLAQHNLIVEDWGGDIMCVPISAKTGKGVDNLLELVALQAQLMELKTSLIAPAAGYILEAKMEKGRGPIGMLLLNQGILHVGDSFIAGVVGGKVTSIIDQMGKQLLSVGPSVPVQIAGFESLADAGDQFVFATRSEVLRLDQNSVYQPSVSQSSGGIKIFIKTDNDSTKEAVVDSIGVINKNSKKQFDILRAFVGPVTEGDVQSAYSVQADIVALHSRIEAKAALLAQSKKVTIHYFDIIYKMTEFLQQWSASESLQAVTIRKKIGTAEVLRVFDIKNIGVVAGCIVRDGRFVRDGLVVILRHGKKVGEGKIKSLQREKRVVKEVHSGFECGFVVEGFSDWIIGDHADCYVTHVEMK